MNNLFDKGEKCEFHNSQVIFLDYIVSQEGIVMDQAKVQAAAGWLVSQTIKDLQRFLGFANLYH